MMSFNNDDKNNRGAHSAYNTILFDDNDSFIHLLSSETKQRPAKDVHCKTPQNLYPPLDGFTADDFADSQAFGDPENSNMNMAIINTEAMAEFCSPICPRPSETHKRKAINLDTPDSRILPKRRPLFKTPAPVAKAQNPNFFENDNDFFHSQFLKQVDSLSGDDTTTKENVSLSQFFQASQVHGLAQTQRMELNNDAPIPPLHLTQMMNDDEGFLDQVEDQLSNESCPIRWEEPSTSTTAAPVQRTASGFTQLLTDDHMFSDLPQCTQRFMSDLKNVQTNHQPVPTEIEPVTIYKSVNHATAYIELQREMCEVNEVNVNDDNFLDTELSQAYKSTQYRREVEQVFDQCEKSICDQNKKQQPDAQPSDADLLSGLDQLDWTQQDFVKTPIRDISPGQVRRTPITSPTNLVRERLENLKRSANTSKLEPSVTTTFHSMGPFFGLPLKVKELIKDYKGISELYAWQKECLTLPAIRRRDNLIYALPTSGGKTLVSEIIILREILCRRKNCLFILPYVSIVQEKLWALSPFAVQLDFLLEEYAAGKGSLPPQRRRKKRSIYVATIEKGLALLDSLIETNRAHELGLIVVDELHIIGEPDRGFKLETLLTKAVYIKAGIQIVGMSATIGNLPEIAKFLHADVYTRDFRPVELREYIKCGKDIMQINAGRSSDISQSFQYVRSVEFNYRDDVERQDPDHLAGLVSEVIPENSCLVFCPSKQNCENVALLLCKLLPRHYREHKSNHRTELKKFMEKDGPMCSILARTLPFGIAYHHSGLTGDERRSLEDAFRQNIICVICCTSTLAAGVNLPAKRVILRSPYVGRSFITLSRYKQMVGRAGRAGLCGDVGESILICAPRDNVNVGQLLCSPMDEAASSMHLDNGKGVESMILSAIGLGMAVTRTDLNALVDTTLLGVQAKRLGIDTKAMTNDIITKLFRMKTLSVKSCSAAFAANQSLDVNLSSQDRDGETQRTSDESRRAKTSVRLKPSTPMEVSSMGRASFKSGFDMERANVLHKDLVQAQRSLVLLNYLHLLYVITPYEPDSINVRPDSAVYYSHYMKLDAKQLHVASVLGLTESCALRIMNHKSMKTPELERIVQRFFFTLILNDLWEQRTVYEVAERFKVNRGIVQNLVVASASFASGVLKFCEELDEFWAFRELLKLITKRLSYCCTAELVPLMDLPNVKLVRAKQLYSAGFKSLESIAKADVAVLVNTIEHLTQRVAKQLISSAKVLLLEKVETLREEVQDCLEVLESGKTH